MNQLNLNQKAGSELLSLRSCFVCGKEIFVRNVRAQNYCSSQCFDARAWARRYTSKEKGLIPTEVQATIRQKFSRQGAQREWDRLAGEDEIARRKRFDRAAGRPFKWNEAVKAMWR